MRDGQQSEYNGITLIVSGILLVIVSIGGYYCGSLLDRVFHSAPIVAISGLIIGVLFGFWDLYRKAALVMSQQPMPSQDAQQRAKDTWEKAEKTSGDERDRDEDHEE